MILGWQDFMEMSWTWKNAQDCEMDGGEQLRQNSTVKPRRQAAQFGWSRGDLEVNNGRQDWEGELDPVLEGHKCQARASVLTFTAREQLGTPEDF